MTPDARGSAAVELARRGDRAAFGALVEDHLDEAFRLASVLIGPGLAEAAVEDAFVAAWRQLPRLADPDEFERWLESILVGVCAMHARRAGPPEATGESGGDGRGAPPSVRSDALEREQALRLLDDAFVRLEPSDRAVLALHEVAGHTPAEIARIVHEPIGPVRVRIADSTAEVLRALEADA